MAILSKPIWLLLAICATVTILFMLKMAFPSSSSVTGRKLNIDYATNTLGDIVIKYHKDKGLLPDTFEQALQYSDVHLSHRGDYFGHPIAYRKLSDISFCFAFGATASNQDIVFTYSDGKWTSATQWTSQQVAEPDRKHVAQEGE